jgi:UDP-2,3-diacylglucosamine pyrophosphatase LpxH
MKKRERILFIPDIQVPDQDERALTLFCKIVKDYVKPDRAIYLGDVINFDAISKYEKIQADVTIEHELLTLQKVFEQIHKSLPAKCRRQLIRGNHEERLPKYLYRNAPGIADLRYFSLRMVLALDSNAIEGPFERIELCNGKFVVTHGHPYAGVVPGSVARKWLEVEGRSGICGHIHRLCTIGKTVYNETMSWTEGGSLCKNPLPYLGGRRADWQLGMCWGLFGEEDFALFEIRFHTGYSWVSPDGREWRA